MKPSDILSVEFLEQKSFSKVQFPDGFFFVRNYTKSYFLQVNEALTEFTECDYDWVEQLTEKEFVDTIIQHEKAINQYI